jgi:anti-sigma regulatory factor (Ser/Thr protein kinase)
MGADVTAKPQMDLDGASTATILNSHSGLIQGLEWLGAWLKSHAVKTETDDRAHLVFEEIVTNIIRYGFADNREHAIKVGARIETGGDVTLTFDDDGRPFDPRSAPPFSKPEKLERAPIGGRGLMLVRRAARHLDYRRTDEGRNILSVTLQSA